MTEQGQHYIAEYQKGNVLEESMQVLYEKGHITQTEFTETVGHEPKQIDISSAPTIEERVTQLETANSDMETLIVDLQYQLDTINI